MDRRREQLTPGLVELSRRRWRCRSPPAGRRGGTGPARPSGSTLPSPARPPQRSARRGARERHRLCGAGERERGRKRWCVCVSREGRTPAYRGRALSQPLISAVAMKARLVTIPALAVSARPPGCPQNGNIAPPALPTGGLHGYSALDE